MRGLVAGVVVAAVCACGPGRSTAPAPGDQPSGVPAGGNAGGGTGGTGTDAAGNTGAGDPGASGSSDTGGGQTGTGGGTAGGGATVPPPAPATCTPKARPACGISDVDPRRPIACRPQPFPQVAAEPMLPTDISAGAACDDREYDPMGNLYSHTTRRFDSAGRPVQVISAASDRTTAASFQYDGCGHLVTSKVKDLDHPGQILQQSSSGYGADGLLRTAVEVSNGQCQRTDYEYSFDDKGRVNSIFDPNTCLERHRFTYDASGRVSGVDDFFGEDLVPKWTTPTSATSYSYHPNGVVQETKRSSFLYGYYSNRQYDADGYLINTSNNIAGGSTASVTTEIWSYDSSHRMLEFDHYFEGVGCQSGSRTLTFSYDGGGVLLGATDTQSTSRGPCMSGPPISKVTAYARPSPGDIVAQTKDDKGNVLSYETTTWDAKGNATGQTRASGPELFAVRVFQRDFSCHK
jgi:hypothetical protein